MEIYQATRHHFFRIWVRKLFFKDVVHLFPVGIRSNECQNQQLNYQFLSFGHNISHSVEIYQATRHHFFRIWVRKLFFKDVVHLFPVGIRSCVCQNQHHSQLPYINHSVYKPNRRKRPHFLFFYCLLPKYVLKPKL